MSESGIMLRQIRQKMGTLVYRNKAKRFRRSPYWERHPDNIRRAPTDWEVLHADLEAECAAKGIPLEDFEVDPPEYARFKEQVRLPAWSLYAVSCREKKMIEHFVSFKLLDLRPGERYLDVASESSPFPGIFRRRLGVDAYSQDLTYPEGVHGHRIGSSADDLPVPNRWVDKASLHCAFEHFEGEVDSGFVRELARCLKPGGRCVIVPVYLDENPFNLYDPILYERWDAERADPEATVVAEVALGGYFERIYSPATFARRVLLPDLGLRYRMFRITGKDEAVEDRSRRSLNQVHRVRYALLIEKQAEQAASAEGALPGTA
jgi:SAM-dependent methyltransferase